MKLREFLDNLKRKNTKITLCMNDEGSKEYNGTVGTLIHWVHLPEYLDYFVDNIYTDEGHFIVFLEM